MSGPQDDIVDLRADRREARLRELGTRTPCCATTGCQEDDPEALAGVAPKLLCYEHLADALGRSWTEAHHVAGEHNDPTTGDIPGNDHRILTALQQHEWPRATLRNADGSPLLSAAAAIRGWLDILRLILERTVGWVPAFLEWLDQQLTAYMGPSWWVTLGYGGRGG